MRRGVVERLRICRANAACGGRTLIGGDVGGGCSLIGGDVGGEGALIGGDVGGGRALIDADAAPGLIVRKETLVAFCALSVHVVDAGFLLLWHSSELVQKRAVVPVLTLVFLIVNAKFPRLTFTIHNAEGYRKLSSTFP